MNRIPLLTKISYGAGQIADAIVGNAFELFLLFYYNQVLGLAGTLAGLALLLAQGIDAITDPVMGSLSDRLHTRWGRRHPWMYLGAIPSGLALAALFNPPAGLAGLGLFAWLAACAIVVRIGTTLFFVPYMALGAELSDDYEERTAVVGFRTGGWVLGGLFFIFVAFGVFFVASEAFPDGQLNPHAYPGFGVFFAVAVTLVMLASAAGTHRQIARLRTAPETENVFGLRTLLSELWGAVQNPSFRILMLGLIAFHVMRGLQGTLGLHAATWFWDLDTKQIEGIVLAILVGFLIGVPFSRLLNRRFDKKWIFIGAIAWALFFHAAPIVLRLIGAFPTTNDTTLVAILSVAALIGGAGAVQALIAGGSMIADIADEQELQTGLRQEGTFFGGVNFASKTAAGIGNIVAGAALDLIGFPSQPGAEGVAPDILVRFGIVYGPGVAAIGAIALVIFWRYRLTRERVAEVQAALRRDEAA